MRHRSQFSISSSYCVSFSVVILEKVFCTTTVWQSRVYRRFP